MIHVLVEDKADGYKIVQKITEIYFQDNPYIQISSLKGIWDLEKKLREKFESIEDDDVLVVVFDDVMENPIVESEIINAHRYIALNHLESRIKWVPTLSFEIEVLLVMGIELFANKANYSTYFASLRDLYNETKEIMDLTEASKSDGKYADWYAEERVKKNKIGRYRALGSTDFERAITIESISKKILSEVFKDNYELVKPMGDCWYSGCCVKNRKACKHFDINKLLDDPMLKLKWLIQNTNYERVIKVLEKLLNLNAGIKEIVLADMLAEGITE